MAGTPSESFETAVHQELLAKLQSFPLTDAGNSGVLELLYKNQLLYDYSVGRWRVWNGRYWPLDDKGRAESGSS